jgi:hypothetical protein
MKVGVISGYGIHDQLMNEPQERVGPNSIAFLIRLCLKSLPTSDKPYIENGFR